MSLALAIFGGACSAAAGGPPHLARLTGPALYGLNYVDNSYDPSLVHRVLLARRGSTLRLGGWALDTRLHVSGGGVIVAIDDRNFIQATYGSARPDVAQYFHSAADLYCGFRAAVPTAQMPAGLHYFRIDVISSSRKGYFSGAEKISFILR